jgi:hypothetical protein
LCWSTWHSEASGWSNGQRRFADDEMKGSARYNAGKDSAQVTIGADIVLTY